MLAALIFDLMRAIGAGDAARHVGLLFAGAPPRAHVEWRPRHSTL